MASLGGCWNHDTSKFATVTFGTCQVGAKFSWRVSSYCQRCEWWMPFQGERGLGADRFRYNPRSTVAETTRSAFQI